MDKLIDTFASNEARIAKFREVSFLILYAALLELNVRVLYSLYSDNVAFVYRPKPLSVTADK